MRVGIKRVILVCGVLLAGVAFSGCVEMEAADKEQDHLWLRSMASDLPKLPGDVGKGYKDVFLRSDNLTAILLAGGASIAMNNTDADRTIARNMRDHQPIDGFPSEVFKTIGSPSFHFAATGLWYAMAANGQDQVNMQRSYTMIKSLSVTMLTTYALKAIRDNKTPNGKSWAWPSGHTASSVTVASVLDEIYGPGVGVPAYCLAALVGLRQMSEGDHWASDVVFGATLGWVVGHTIAGKDKQLQIAGFDVVPYAGPYLEGNIYGVNLVKRF